LVLRLQVKKYKGEGRLGSSAQAEADPQRPVVASCEDESGMGVREGCGKLLPAMGAREIMAVDGVRPWPDC